MSKSTCGFREEVWKHWSLPVECLLMPQDPEQFWQRVVFHLDNLLSNWNGSKPCPCLNIIVVYFDQHLSAAHSEHWSKHAFSTFFMVKSKKRKKKQEFWKAVWSVYKFVRTTGVTTFCIQNIFSPLKMFFAGNKTFGQRFDANKKMFLL